MVTRVAIYDRSYGYSHGQDHASYVSYAPPPMHALWAVMPHDRSYGYSHGQAYLEACSHSSTFG